MMVGSRNKWFSHAVEKEAVRNLASQRGGVLQVDR